MLHQKEKEIPLTFALHRFLPHNLYTRLFSIGAGERSVEGRLSFYRDALKIIGDYPLLGTGGGGWAALYRTYQDRDYTTSEVHSHYLQVAVETGIPGLLAFAGIWVFFLLSFVQGRFRSDSDSTTHCLWATICISALALGIHSAIDFNLSLGAVSIFLYTLLATGRSLAEQSTLPFGMRGRGLRLPYRVSRGQRASPGCCWPWCSSSTRGICGTVTNWETRPSYWPMRASWKKPLPSCSRLFPRLLPDRELSPPGVAL